MPGPNILAQDIRGTGSSIARLLRGSTFAELLGATGVTGVKGGATTTTASYIQRSNLARYKGLIYCATATDIMVLDPIAGTWSISRTYTPLPQPPEFQGNDLIVIDTPSGSFLIAYHRYVSGGALESFLRFDGTTWSQAQIGVFGGASSTTGLFYYKGIVYGYQNQQSNTSNTLNVYDPVTLTISRQVLSHPGVTALDGSFFTLDDRLFLLLSGAASLPPVVLEFTLGSWLDTGVALPAMGSNGGKGCAIRIGQDVLYFQGDGGTSALRCLAFTVATPGSVLSFAELTVPIPPALRAGTAIGNPNQFRLYGLVDTTTTPGSATGYITFFPDASITAIPTMFRWINSTTPMAVAASPQIVGSSGVPVQFYGGGENLNGLGTTTSPLVTTSPEGNAQGTQGVVVSFSAWGDALVVPHDASGGAFTVGLVATQAPSGATGTILRVGANEIWIKNDSGTPWVNGQAITDTSTGSANQNAVTTGGGNDKTVEARYFLGAGSTGLGVPISGVATIVPGSVTGGDGAVEVGNQITNVTADGRTFSFEWDFLSDGVPQALIDSLELFITRP